MDATELCIVVIVLLLVGNWESSELTDCSIATLGFLLVFFILSIFRDFDFVVVLRLVLRVHDSTRLE